MPTAPLKTLSNRSLESALETTFGHKEFRAGQKEVMEVLLEGRSALAVFPTGAGKSLCYQLPALMLPGLTLVISPLIALMREQVETLRSRGIAAARLDSTLDVSEVREIYAAMDRGALKLLYVAPERMANEGFLGKLRRTRLSMIAIDEAHCISEWGHNFRPDYLKLGILARGLGVGRVLCLTATATPAVAADIRRHFEIREGDQVQTGFRRENLQFAVTPCEAAGRKAILLERLMTRPAGAVGATRAIGATRAVRVIGPAIVYVTLQHTAEDVAGFLAREGLRARAYHAGMPDDGRAEVQDGFMEGRIDVVVATIAFGMGIDKADIRYVYHYNLPKSLENYVQESGRAGRDGKLAQCEIFACGDDRIVLENFVYGDTPSAAALKALVEHLLLQGEDFDISRYEISATMDIRPLVVATALTYLELSGVIEPRGPFYSSYRFRFLQPEAKVLSGHDPERRELLERVFEDAVHGRSWWTVDVKKVAEKIGVPMESVREALNHLAELEDVVMQPAGLRHGYRLAGGAVGAGGVMGTREAGAIAEGLRDLFEKREKGEIERVETVIGFCESGECLTRQILEYFGENPGEDCGECGNCRTSRTSRTSRSSRNFRELELGRGRKRRSAALPCGLVDELSLEEVRLIQEVADEGHRSLRQPRQLARFFCGIASPAATRQRLKGHDRFGVLAKLPFQAVLAQAESMVMR